MTNQVAPSGSVLSYPRKLTKGSVSIVVSSPRAHVEAEKAGFVDALGQSLLKQTFPRSVKNAKGQVLVASGQDAYLQYLNDGYSDVSSLA